MSSEGKNAPSMGMRIGRIVVVLAVLAVAAYFGVPLAGSQGGGSGGTSGGGSGAQGGSTPAGSDASSGTQTAERAAPPSRTPNAETPEASTSTTTLDQTQQRVLRLMRERRSGQMVAFDARVLRTLPDDNEGSRHQRFILALEDRSGEHDTILVAHNIDLAARVPLEAGDIVSLYGQYEYNDKGGVVHWTHHDPAGRHEEGWIEHEGVRYE